MRRGADTETGFRIVKIRDEGDPLLNITLDTIRRGKQALIFLNTKQRAEKAAEDLSKHIILNAEEKKKLEELSQKAFSALETPTEQCRKLASAIRQGVAFHHSGLVQEQRELIEENFRSGLIKIICCTPTLAYGLDLPAFRVIVRDLKRFGTRGMDWIPVLEVQQMFGRAGRPSYDSEGEAICIADNEAQEDLIRKRYIHGVPEEIYSKLAVEPVLRTYILSLISAGIVSSRESILSFFTRTFWAHQFRDTNTLYGIIENMLDQLREWGFVEWGHNVKETTEAFVSADELENKRESSIMATRLGQRVSQLYIDPLTAYELINSFQIAEKKEHDTFAVLQRISNTLEMRPLLNVRVKEYEEIEDFLMEHEHLLIQAPRENMTWSMMIL